jgi:hypothetical protein
MKIVACGLLLMLACSCSPLGSSHSGGSDAHEAKRVGKILVELYRGSGPLYYETFTARGPLTKAQFDSERSLREKWSRYRPGDDVNAISVGPDVPYLADFWSHVEEGDRVYAFTGKSHAGSSFITGYVIVHGDEIKHGVVTGI